MVSTASSPLQTTVPRLLSPSPRSNQIHGCFSPLRPIYRSYRRNYRLILLCLLPVIFLGQFGWTRRTNLLLQSSPSAFHFPHDVINYPSFLSNQSAPEIIEKQKSLESSSHTLDGEQATGKNEEKYEMTKESELQNMMHLGDQTVERETTGSDVRDQFHPAKQNVEKIHAETDHNRSPTYDDSLVKGNKSGKDFVTSHGPAKATNTSTVSTPPLLESFVIPREIYQPQSAHPLPVVLIGSKETDESLIDCFDRSKYMNIIQLVRYSRFVRTVQIEESPSFHALDVANSTAVLYAVDWAALERDCHALNFILRTTEKLLSPVNFAYPQLIYLDTTSSAKTVNCPLVDDQFFSKTASRYAKRNMVVDRYWNQTKEWIEAGRLIEDAQKGALHFPHYLREIFVHELMNITRHVGANASDLVAHERKNDVSFAWRKGGNLHYGFLRRHVAALIADFGRDHRSVHWLVRIMGDHLITDKLLVDPSYVDMLLSYKIVVIAQQDEWEDHFRLMESLASGALVLSDAMVAPPVGLKNRTNIVFYDSSLSLIRLLSYYLDPKHKSERLAIARRGCRLAWGRHRSWHAAESLIFGKPLTRVDDARLLAPDRKFLSTSNSGRTALVAAA